MISITPRRISVNSFSSYHPTLISLFEPANTLELQALVRYFYNNGQSYCVTGNGISFDAHFINTNAVISTRYLQRLRIDWDNNCFWAQAGVTWGRVVDQLLPKGYLPLIVPTTSHATIGGSFNCNTYSRMTASDGREAATIEAFELLLPNGECRYCDRQTNADLFRQAIGSYGTIGIVLDVKYRMQYIGESPNFQSSAQGFEGIAGLEHLMPSHSLEGWEAQGYTGSGAFIYWSKGRLRTLVTQHKWVNEPYLKPSILHRSDALRIIGELGIARFPSLARLPLEWTHRQTTRQKMSASYTIDRPRPSMFWLDATLKSRALGQRLGMSPKTLQQSFAIPLNGQRPEDFQRIYKGIAYAMYYIKDLGLTTTMVDVGYLPPAPSFGWSAAPHQQACLLLSITFNGCAIPSYDAINQCFEHLSQYFYDRYEAKIHLTKNVCCSTDLLRKMYADTLPLAQATRQQYDPKGLLRTQLMDRCFPLAKYYVALHGALSMVS